MSPGPEELWRVEQSFHPILLEGDGPTVGHSIGRWSESGLTVRVVRGSRMLTSQRLFDECAAAFQFPWYFGNNWDALDECIADLDWLSRGVGWVIVITEAEQVLLGEPERLKTFMEILRRAHGDWAQPVTLGEHWDRPPIPFHVVLAAVRGLETAAIERWRAAGADLISPGEGSGGLGLGVT